MTTAATPRHEAGARTRTAPRAGRSPPDDDDDDDDAGPARPRRQNGRLPRAYLRGSRAWAPGSTCCRTGRCPPAPWRARGAAGAGRAAPARPSSSRRGAGIPPPRSPPPPPPPPPTGPAPSGLRHVRARRPARGPAPPRRPRSTGADGGGHGSNAARRWWRAACPEPIPATPGPRWRRGAVAAWRCRHVGVHFGSPGRARRSRAVAPGRGHPEVAGTRREWGPVGSAGRRSPGTAASGAARRQPPAPLCRGGLVRPKRGRPEGRAEVCPAAAPLCAPAAGSREPPGPARAPRRRLPRACRVPRLGSFPWGSAVNVRGLAALGWAE